MRCSVLLVDQEWIRLRLALTMERFVYGTFVTTPSLRRHRNVLVAVVEAAAEALCAFLGSGGKP